VLVRLEDGEDGCWLEDGEDGWLAGCDVTGAAGDVAGVDGLVTADPARDPAGEGGPDGCEPDANPVMLISTKQVSAARARAAMTAARR
jgi:hypothetical protein